MMGSSLIRRLLFMSQTENILSARKLINLRGIHEKFCNEAVRKASRVDVKQGFDFGFQKREQLMFGFGVVEKFARRVPELLKCDDLRRTNTNRTHANGEGVELSERIEDQIVDVARATIQQVVDVLNLAVEKNFLSCKKFSG